MAALNFEINKYINEANYINNKQLIGYLIISIHPFSIYFLSYVLISFSTHISIQIKVYYALLIFLCAVTSGLITRLNSININSAKLKSLIKTITWLPTTFLTIFYIAIKQNYDEVTVILILATTNIAILLLKALQYNKFNKKYYLGPTISLAILYAPLLYFNLENYYFFILMSVLLLVRSNHQKNNHRQNKQKKSINFDWRNSIHYIAEVSTKFLIYTFLMYELLVITNNLLFPILILSIFELLAFIYNNTIDVNSSIFFRQTYQSVYSPINLSKSISKPRALNIIQGWSLHIFTFITASVFLIKYLSTTNTGVLNLILISISLIYFKILNDLYHKMNLFYLSSANYLLLLIIGLLMIKTNNTNYIIILIIQAICNNTYINYIINKKNALFYNLFKI